MISGHVLNEILDWQPPAGVTVESIEIPSDSGRPYLVAVKFGVKGGATVKVESGTDPLAITEILGRATDRLIQRPRPVRSAGAQSLMFPNEKRKV